jgi:hypothetical protein
MILDPTSYSCPEHHTDLTAQVAEALDDDAPPFAYVSVFRRKPAGPRPFQVIVTCPGASGSGAHELTCAGQWTR